MFVFAETFDPPPWAFALFFAMLLAVALVARRRNAGDARRILGNDMAARGLGLFVMLVGAGVVYLIAYGPISEAMQGNRTILLWRGAVGVPGVLVICGLALLIAGKRSPRLFLVEEGRELSAFQWGFIAACLAVALALEFGLARYLQMRGYGAWH